MYFGVVYIFIVCMGIINGFNGFLKRRYECGEVIWRGLGEVDGEKLGRNYRNVVYIYRKFFKNKLKLWI